MRFRNLDKYRTGGSESQKELSIPLPKTPDGRVYRYSPNADAHPRHFVLGDAQRPDDISETMRARMKLEPGSPQTVCPYSGIVEADQAFTHPDDREAVLELVKHAAFADVQDEFARMFDDINRRQPRNSLIRIEAKVSKRSRPRPRFYRSDLLRELVCDHCGRDYGVYAIGLFCPDCGAPNLHLHFAREVALVEAQVALADQLDAAQEELAYRLLGNAHEDVLTAFEATLKTVYLFGWRVAKPLDPLPKVGNDFQNVERGQKRFAELGLDPYALLDGDALTTMKLNIQKRHVIGHNLGVIDAKFAELSGEANIGETVHLVAEDIRAFAHLAQQVVDGLDAWLAGTPIPPRDRSEEVAEPVTNASSAPGEQLRLSPLAYAVGEWLAHHSEDGQNDPASQGALEAAFAETPQRDLEDAVAELEVDGYITANRLIGRRLPRIGYRTELFATFDPLTLGSDPTLDAVELAKRCLKVEEGVSVPQLHEHIGWDRRRFNPALNIVLSYIDDRRVGKGGDGRYPARHFFLQSDDRVTLKRFVARHT
jgi:hypothetical protein